MTRNVGGTGDVATTSGEIVLVGGALVGVDVAITEEEEARGEVWFDDMATTDGWIDAGSKLVGRCAVVEGR